MVYLNRIYTRSGDDGTTALGTGERLPKTALRIRAYGAVDELNSSLGIVSTQVSQAPYSEWLRQIQNDLFDVGADLCVPAESEASNADALRVQSASSERIEGWIDQVNEKLQPLTSFVLPGGTPTAAHLHHARTVCRRAEIEILQLHESEPVGKPLRQYINRLSDFLFVLARHFNSDGSQDILWTPGTGQQS